jgi:hypothetical protein
MLSDSKTICWKWRGDEFLPKRKLSGECGENSCYWKPGTFSKANASWLNSAH